jgi:hypothetical protein
VGLYFRNKALDFSAKVFGCKTGHHILYNFFFFHISFLHQLWWEENFLDLRNARNYGLELMSSYKSLWWLSCYHWDMVKSNSRCFHLESGFFHHYQIGRRHEVWIDNNPWISLNNSILLNAKILMHHVYSYTASHLKLRVCVSYEGIFIFEQGAWHLTISNRFIATVFAACSNTHLSFFFFQLYTTSGSK